jgi:hypothetical protein
MAENSRLYIGPVAYCKGASSEQKALEASQTNFYNTLLQQQQAQFGKQDALYAAVRGVYDPIIAAGPNQYGFAGAEDRALRTQASEGTAAQYRQAEAATSAAMAARGGGNSFLPSGAEADIHSRVAGAAAAQESSQQLGITKAGYEVGRENFNNATGVEMGIASGYNPLGYANSATTAGNSAFNMASEIQKANAAASPWGTIGGLVGGIAGSFAGPFGAALGKKVGGFLGNAGSGNAGSPVNTDLYSTDSYTGGE